jgi:hypothetical protein
MMTTDQEEFRRSLTILHLALCLGCAAFLGVTAYLWGKAVTPLFSSGTIPWLSELGVATAVILPTIAVILFRRRIRSVVEAGGGTDPLMPIRAACVMHWAVIESALLFNLVIFMLQAQPLHWGIAAALLVLMVLRAPTERRLQRWTTGTP